MNYTFQLFTNETFDPTRKYNNFMHGYRPGAYMKLAYVGPVIADSDLEAAEAIFHTFNVNHPADYKSHSMSVGDVVSLKDETGTVRSYSCEFLGFTLLDSFDPNNKNPEWVDLDTYFANRNYYEALIRQSY